jgi:APA family basic amino acid/polyamine antiporter
MFLAAKSASAATAALGFAGYVIVAVDGPASAVVPLALLAVLVIGAVVTSGIRRSAIVNTLVVGIALGALILFLAGGVGNLSSTNFTAGGFFGGGPTGWLEATALMFVAYTGYGRIATLGEEVQRPERTIPIAIIATMGITIALYTAVAAVGVGTVGSAEIAAATEGPAAPLATVAISYGATGIARIVEIGAVAAMLGVLLNLMLGLSRVVLAMGRRADLPTRLAAVDEVRSTPRPATITVVLAIALIALIGDVRTTWTFSAMTVLVYYAITNLAALRLPPEDRRFPRWIAWAGLIACLSLAAFVDVRAWLAAAAILATGWGLRALVRRTRAT